jgi:2-haloacid dehalogenase
MVEKQPVRTIVFDVNETLLDLRAMRPRFEEALGSIELVGAWFGQLLRHSLVATLTDAYQPFDVLAVDALRLVAARAGIDLSEAEAAGVVDGMRHLPPHPDVRPAISQLRDHGFRISTLTNSPPHLLAAQLANAEIDDLFDVTLSIEPIRKFKPHPDTYRSGAERLGVDIADIRLVAAHDWDVTGAIRTGAAAAFVARPGMILSEASETPDVVGSDLLTVAAAIIDIDG